MPENNGYMSNMYAGAGHGLENLSAGTQIGASRLMADIGSMMPPIASPNIHPMIRARHGLYANEMSLTGSMGALIGRGIPETTTAFEYQEMAARDVGQRVAGAATMGGLYGSSAAVGWFGGGAAMAQGFKFGNKAARNSKLAMSSVSAIRGLGASAGVATAAAKGIGVMGGLVGAIPAIAAFEGISAFTEAVATDVKDRREIMNFVEASSFRYAQGTGSDIDQRMGGFNRQARSKIASKIKDVDYSDASLDMTDLKGILESGTEMGMFSGVKDAEEFGSKFKDLTSTLKKVTTTLHQSLAEGMKTIKSLKDSGFSTPSEMSGAIMSADVLGSASGKTAAEMLSIGTQGAEMVRGTGMAMSAGANMMMQNSAAVSRMAASGVLSSHDIAQAGGQGALAQQMMGSNINFMRSNLGRGAMTAMMGGDGGLDMGALDRIAGGNQGLGDIVNMGAGAMSSSGAYIKGVVNQGQRMKELSEAYGGQGVEIAAMSVHAASAKSLVESGATDSKVDAMKFSMKKAGYSDSAIAGMLGKLENIDELRQSNSQEFDKQASKAASELVRRKTDVMGRMGDKIHRSIIAPISGGVNDAYDTIAEGTENAYRGARDWVQEKMFGIKKVQLENIKPGEILDIIAENKGEGGPQISKELRSQDFTDGESKAFSENNPKYKKMMGKFGLKAMSKDAQAAGGIDEYSKTVFGKGWDSLSKDEKMYAESMVSRMGKDGLKEDIDDRQEVAREKIDGVREEFIAGSDAKKAEAQKAVNNSVGAIAKAVGMGGLHGNVMAETIEKDDKAKENFEGILKAKSNIKKLEAEKMASTMAGKEFDKEEQLQEAQGNLAEFSLKLGKQMSQQGSLGEVAAERFMKGIGGSDITGGAEAYAKGSADLDKAQGSKKYRQLVGTASKSLDAFSSLSIRRLEKEDRSKFTSLLTQFKEGLADGEGLDEDDSAEFAALSKKAGFSSLGFLGRVSEMAQDEGSMSPDKASKFLDKVGIKADPKALLKAFGKDVSPKEIMQYSTIREMSQKGGSTVFGAGGSDDMKSQEASAMATLTDVQRKAEMIAHRYEILAERLGIK